MKRIAWDSDNAVSVFGFEMCFRDCGDIYVIVYNISRQLFDSVWLGECSSVDDVKRWCCVVVFGLRRRGWYETTAKRCKAS